MQTKGEANMEYCIKQRWSSNTGCLVIIVYFLLPFLLSEFLCWFAFNEFLPSVFLLTWAVQTSLHSVRQKLQYWAHKQARLRPQGDSSSTSVCFLSDLCTSKTPDVNWGAKLNFLYWLIFNDWLKNRLGISLWGGSCHFSFLLRKLVI